MQKPLLNKSFYNLSKRVRNVKADAYLSGEIILSSKQIMPLAYTYTDQLKDIVWKNTFY